jgi:hypothetical protein
VYSGVADVGAVGTNDDLLEQFEGENKSAEHVIETPAAIS